MLDTQREINVFLPNPRQDCRQIFQQAPAWAERFDQVLSRVNSVTEDTQASCMDESVNRDFARLRAHGAGLLRAERLDAELHVWPKQNFPCPYPTLNQESGLVAAGPVRRATGEVGGETYAIRAMLFGDVKGYSKLSDVELLQFTRQFMTRIAAVLVDHSSGILSRRTAGDGLFLVFADLETAAQVALQLRDMVAGTRWEECELPANLGIRISLDAGPVYVYQDPVTRGDEVCGLYVNRAARIEPITPPNQVYASEAFAALYVAAGRQSLRFDYVGQTQLPKGFGLIPLYCCQPDSRDSSC
jgi:class 3 adenylate cyclase